MSALLIPVWENYGCGAEFFGFSFHSKYQNDKVYYRGFGRYLVRDWSEKILTEIVVLLCGYLVGGISTEIVVFADFSFEFRSRYSPQRVDKALRV